MSASLRHLIPELYPFASALVDAAAAAGLQPRVTSTLRTHAEQTRLYRRWQQGLSPLPAAPPGSSAHEYGWALDLVVSPYEALSDVGEYWESLGGVWGGRFNDPVHFEYPGWTAPQIVDESVAANITRSVGEVLNSPVGWFAPFQIGTAQDSSADVGLRILKVLGF